MTTTYDAIIIGTGQAGPFLAQRVAASGMKVAIIERKLFGGTCVVGGPLSVDMKRVKARREELPGKSRIAVEALLRTLKNCTVHQGQPLAETSATPVR
ncbi:MAG TPA: FAD-dependent oxidoreductase [Candidatus Acidoferrales bacterium]|nr:FAD-dependent oxidoreductase [Candidatus Acidoferrales bacterium]